MKHRIFRRCGALALAALTLWAAWVTAGSATPAEALSALGSASVPRLLIRWELGDLSGGGTLSLPTLLALSPSPLLLAAREAVAAAPDREHDDSADVPDDPVVTPPDPAPPTPAIPQDLASLAEGLTFADNGVRSETVAPVNTANYVVAGDVLIRNRSDRTLDPAALAAGDFAARFQPEGPQVLIVHTHGSEAYTMPPGEEYVPSGSYRTADTAANVVRIGDEMAAVLSRRGISVLHDRTLHDVPSYNDAYYNSYDAIEAYREKYPTLTYVLDIHRDAVSDADGNQYKLVAAEEPRAAQLSLVMGVKQDGWEENVKLAVAVQHTIRQTFPTLMRPISVVYANYNQGLAPGSLLVEVGTAGNSLDEAIYAGRLFAQGFADTILANGGG
jgi:stage II sporulation protein P